MNCWPSLLEIDGAMKDILQMNEESHTGASTLHNHQQRPVLQQVCKGPRIILIYVRLPIRTYREPGGPEGHVLIRTYRPPKGSEAMSIIRTSVRRGCQGHVTIQTSGWLSGQYPSVPICGCDKASCSNPDFIVAFLYLTHARIGD